MRKIERLWIEAIIEQIDVRLINILGKLKVLSRKTWGQSAHDAQSRYTLTISRQMIRKSAHIERQPQTYSRAPKSIKPTRSRTYR